jgi:signal transduction histidine kinase
MGLSSSQEPSCELDYGPLRDGDAEHAGLADPLAQERLRIAAAIHDLVMQDLAFALATARVLVAEDAAATASLAHGVVAAGERALSGARSIVAEMLAPARKPVVEAVEEGARAAARHVPLSYAADAVAAGSQPDEATLDALVHVAREAVANAIKHAEPCMIEVVLAHADEWRLLVRDNGLGFDPGVGGRGFGLESMKRHADALGGSLSVNSALGAGTTVELVLP